MGSPPASGIPSPWPAHEKESTDAHTQAARARCVIELEEGTTALPSRRLQAATALVDGVGPSFGRNRVRAHRRPATGSPARKRGTRARKNRSLRRATPPRKTRWQSPPRTTRIPSTSDADPQSSSMRSLHAPTDPLLRAPELPERSIPRSGDLSAGPGHRFSGAPKARSALHFWSVGSEFSESDTEFRRRRPPATPAPGASPDRPRPRRGRGSWGVIPAERRCSDRARRRLAERAEESPSLQSASCSGHAVACALHHDPRFAHFTADRLRWSPDRAGRRRGCGCA